MPITCILKSVDFVLELVHALKTKCLIQLSQEVSAEVHLQGGKVDDITIIVAYVDEEMLTPQQAASVASGVV